MYVVQSEVYFSRWRLPPSWITKTAAISLLSDRSSPKLVETLVLRFGTYRWRRKCIVVRIQDSSRRVSKNSCNFFTIWSIIAKFVRNIATLIKKTSMTSKKPSSWILKNYFCHFFTIWPIFTKLSENIGISILNTSITLKMHRPIVAKIQDDVRHHPEFRKTVVVSLIGHIVD